MNAPSVSILREACETLSARSRPLAKAYDAVGLPVWRTANPTYQTLARSVVYQLISTRAADAIWQRVLDRHPSISADAILNDDEEGLRSCGLSGPKVKHLQAIADAVRLGDLDFDRLLVLPIDKARQELLAVRGIGPWTAESFLMMAIGHLDAFPIGDVGLMESHKRLSGAPERDDKKAFTARAERWRPYRAVAAHLLYGWLKATR